MLFGKIFYMIHRTISVRFLRDTIRSKTFFWHEKTENRGLSPLFALSEKRQKKCHRFWRWLCFYYILWKILFLFFWVCLEPFEPCFVNLVAPLSLHFLCHERICKSVLDDLLYVFKCKAKFTVDVPVFIDE